jgi:hypothetical protein
MVTVIPKKTGFPTLSFSSDESGATRLLKFERGYARPGFDSVSL